MLYYYPALEDKSVQLTQCNSYWLCPDEFDVQDNRGYLLPGVDTEGIFGPRLQKADSLLFATQTQSWFLTGHQSNNCYGVSMYRIRFSGPLKMAEDIK